MLKSLFRFVLQSYLVLLTINQGEFLKKKPMTQFQIEGGGMVQGVTKLIMTFSTFFYSKNLDMLIDLRKYGVDSL